MSYAYDYNYNMMQLCYNYGYCPTSIQFLQLQQDVAAAQGQVLVSDSMLRAQQAIVDEFEHEASNVDPRSFDFLSFDVPSSYLFC